MVHPVRRAHWQRCMASLQLVQVSSTLQPDLRPHLQSCIGVLYRKMKEYPACGWHVGLPLFWLM